MIFLQRLLCFTFEDLTYPNTSHKKTFSENEMWVTLFLTWEKEMQLQLLWQNLIGEKLIYNWNIKEVWVKYRAKNSNSTEIQIGTWIRFNDLTKLSGIDHLRMVFKKLVHLISNHRVESMVWSSSPKLVLTESYSTWEVLEGVRNISSSSHDGVCQSQRGKDRPWTLKIISIINSCTQSFILC